MDMEKNNVSRNELNCDTSCAAVTNGNDGPDGTVQTVPLAPKAFSHMTLRIPIHPQTTVM